MIRRWYINSTHSPTAKPDGDPVNVDGAGGGAYMEALPDTFVTDDDRAIDGLNLGLHPGSVAVLCYKVHFSQPGRYYLWTRMRSDVEEDNTLNAGLNDEWPASAKCLHLKTFETLVVGDVIRDPKGPQYPRCPPGWMCHRRGSHRRIHTRRCCFDCFILTTMQFAKEGAGPAATPARLGQLPVRFPHEVRRRQDTPSSPTANLAAAQVEPPSGAASLPVLPVRFAQDPQRPTDRRGPVFEEADGQIASKEAVTRPTRRSAGKSPVPFSRAAGRDIDPPHFADASGVPYRGAADTA
jgi:hypothetical protein